MLTTALHCHRRRTYYCRHAVDGTFLLGIIDTFGRPRFFLTDEN